jgi:hypothetical protein
MRLRLPRQSIKGLPFLQVSREGGCTAWGSYYETALDVRLIRNAAALVAASQTLLFNDWKNAARLKRNESDWLRHASSSEVLCATHCTEKAILLRSGLLADQSETASPWLGVWGKPPAARGLGLRSIVDLQVASEYF